MKTKILYLYAELHGYQIAVFEELVKNHNAQLLVFHDVRGKESKYSLPNIENILFFDKDQFSDLAFRKIVLEFNPELVYISGWMYFKYLKITYYLRKKNVIVVTGFDDIWHGSLKQRIASLFFPYFRKKIFSHAWVAGPYQFEYASKLGFKKDEIIFNCLSADSSKFVKSYYDKKSRKESIYPHRFLYVGRFNKIKGVDILLNAWDLLGDEKKDWTLTFVGNGPLFEQISQNDSVNSFDFLQPDELAQILSDYGCLIIPSRSEQWSLVMHEFSTAGFPLIASSICGAIPFFLIPGFNGFIFKNENYVDLANKMKKIINSTDDELNLLSSNSHVLGSRINTALSASSLMSLIIK